MFIFCIYRPPSADVSIYDAITDKIDAIQEIHPKSEVIVLGDMNAHHEEWLGGRKTDTHGDSAFQFAVLNNLHQLVDLPTRTGKDGECSKLDLFLTTSSGNHVVTVSAPLGSSDLSVVSTLANYRLPTLSKASKRKVWLYDKADRDGMRSFLASVEWAALSKGHSADLAWSCVKDNLADVMDLYVPTKQTSHRYSDKPWFNELCHEDVQYKQKANKKWQKRRTKDSWTLYLQSTSDCQRSLRRARLQFP